MSKEKTTREAEQRAVPTDEDGEHNVSTESSLESPGVGRRPVLKALGVAATLSVGSGVATGEHDNPHPPHIDSHYGYATPDAENIPQELEPDHTVELHIGAPTPGEHGPLFHFEPAGLSVNAGDIVQFLFTTPDHTITAYHPAHGFQRRIPEEAPQFSSPVVSAGGAWLYQFEQEGLYDIYCAPHHILGMNMRIIVGTLGDEDVPDYEDTFEGSEGPPPLLAPFSKEFLETELNGFSDENDDCEWVWLTPEEVLDTEALDPANIQADNGRVSFANVLADIDRISGGHSHE